MVAYILSEIVMPEARTSWRKRMSFADKNRSWSVDPFLLSAFQGGSRTSMKKVCFGKR